MQRKSADEYEPRIIHKANATAHANYCKTRIVRKLNNNELRVVHAPSESEPFLIIWKPRGVKSAPLYEGEAATAEDFAARLFPELKNVHGTKSCEHGLLHRLDTDACGLLLFAVTQTAYNALSLSQAHGEFIKTYRVLCDFNKENARTLAGFPPLSAMYNTRGSVQNFTENDAHAYTAGDALTVSSFFRAYRKGRREVRPVVESSPPAARKKATVKRYTTHIEIVENASDGVLTECSLSRGFRHQVRCHLAWLGLPARGDKLYNAAYIGEGASHEILCFECVALEFPNPLTGKILRFARNKT